MSLSAFLSVCKILALHHRKPDPVDADTLFPAASNTKAMTTLLLAELVDERKLQWDEPLPRSIRTSGSEMLTPRGRSS